MNIITTPQARFFQTPEGATWSSNPSFVYGFWKWYLEVFDNISLLARVKHVERPPEDTMPVSGPGIKFIALPYSESLWQFAAYYRMTEKYIREEIKKDSAVLLRIPCPVADIAWRCIEPGRPYAVQAVTDPDDLYSPHATKVPLRFLVRSIAVSRMKLECLNACAALYVTKEYLQHRYPCRSYSAGVSDIDFEDSAFVTAPRTIETNKKSFVITTVSQLEPYKALDIAISAIHRLLQKGFDLKFVIIGSGKCRARLEEQVASLSLGEKIVFTGALPFDAITPHLDRTDLFILPSRAEGLPRALVEAMARALPCIGSTAGGIPELLPSEDMIASGSAEELADKIAIVLRDPARMAVMSSRNLARANEYRRISLRPKRIEFLKYLYQRTEEWNRKKYR